MNDKNFYDMWDQDDKPVSKEQAAVVIDAKKLAETFKEDRKVYIVRGTDMFVVHSSDIKVVKNEDGSRRIVVENGSMVKYENGVTRVLG